jgi:hypothetical protein
MSLIALYYVCSVEIYYNVYHFKKHGAIHSLEVFKNQLQRLTYQDILKLWEQERQTKEEWESQAKPIM